MMITVGPTHELCRSAIVCLAQALFVALPQGDIERLSHLAVVMEPAQRWATKHAAIEAMSTAIEAHIVQPENFSFLCFRAIGLLADAFQNDVNRQTALQALTGPIADSESVLAQLNKALKAYEDFTKTYSSPVQALS